MIWALSRPVAAGSSLPPRLFFLLLLLFLLFCLGFVCFCLLSLVLVVFVCCFGWFLLGFCWFWLVSAGFVWFWFVLCGFGWFGFGFGGLACSCLHLPLPESCPSTNLTQLYAQYHFILAIALAESTRAGAETLQASPCALPQLLASCPDGFFVAVMMNQVSGAPQSNVLSEPWVRWPLPALPTHFDHLLTRCNI